MFKIKIDQLKIRAKIGASKKERSYKQLLLVSLIFSYKLKKGVNSNNVNNLINYSDIIKHLNHYIGNSKFQTLEKLIFECTNNLKRQFNIQNILLEIKKPEVAKKYRCRSISVSQ